ncbi:hypothetical protein [Aliiglaciecola lipolytica]|uniref:Uncharacterized protein n=1 Tax=Aliiglaciecola lipolytica E3 TaxID=1127673 RepID=K6YGF9_9ALTE|nr:hypothetical protein [Aliiglaciecola lipolytica]GAC15718.1 hypothetical protein GLIP_3097 [Aliiglaciecola lipolytica E3]
MLDLLAKQKNQVDNAANLYRAAYLNKHHILDKAQDQSKQWIGSPKGLLVSFAAGTCYELQSSSQAHSSRTLMTLLLRFI